MSSLQSTRLTRLACKNRSMNDRSQLSCWNVLMSLGPDCDYLCVLDMQNRVPRHIGLAGFARVPDAGVPR